MKTIIATKEEVCRRACDAVCALVEKKPDAVLSFAVGESTEPLFALLAESGCELSGVRLFELSAYEDCSVLRDTLTEKLISKTNIKPENCVFLSGDTLDEYDALLERAGGLDLAVLGIGQNCHIGFNEPATPFDSLTHRQKLTDSTRRMKAEAFGGEEKVPAYGYTMGIKTITSAKNILLLAFGEKKAAPVFNMLYGKTMSYLPASFLQIPLNVTVYLDEGAASKL